MNLVSQEEGIKKSFEKDNDYWIRFWEQQSLSASSDYEADRVSSNQNFKLDQLSEIKVIEFIDPKPQDCILDAGCGTGINISRLHTFVSEIVGIDFSKGMVERLRERIGREEIHNVKIMVGNITATKFSSDYFSKVICMSVLQYLSDKECISALKELIRVSKDNGIIILHVKNLISLNLLSIYIAKKIKRLFIRKGEVDHYHYRTRNWYEKQLMKFGAQIMDYDSVNFIALDLFPNLLLNKLRMSEMKMKKGKFFKKFGADYFIKAKVLKQ